MDIIYLHQYYNSPTSQGSTRSYEMAKRLVSKGHNVHMVTSFREDNAAKSWFITNDDGIQVHWLPVPYRNEMSYQQRIRAFFRFAIGSGRYAAKLKGDVVFATSTPLTICIPGIWSAGRKRVPFVFEVRDVWPEIPIAIGAIKNPLLKWSAGWLERYAYKKSAEIVALSPGMAASIINRGVDPKKVTVIPNSCDLDIFGDQLSDGLEFRRLHPELGDRPIVLYAGTFGRINEVDYMVNLAKHMSILNPKICFVAIGSGSEKQKIVDLATKSNVLGKNFFLLNPLPKNQIAKAYQAATVVTSWTIDVPVLEHNSANKFFDGLAAGRPVVTNYGGWQAELLRDFDAGFQLGRDPTQACLLLNSYLINEQKLLLMGTNARQLAEKQFSRDDLASQLETVIVRAVSQSTR